MANPDAERDALRASLSRAEDLLAKAFVVLHDFVGDEGCDHDVNICFCAEHELVEEIANHIGEDLAERLVSRRS